jgi:6,7-dimethyl-8-ribityllumazine synthase
MSEQWPGEKPDIEEAEAPVAEADEEVFDDEAEEEPEDEDQELEDEEDAPELRIVEHPDDGIDIPDDVELLEGEARSTRRGVGLIASRERPEQTNAMLTAAFAELEEAGVGREHVTVMLVPGAFELALGAMALAKTRRYSCVVALGDASDSTVIAAEAASGLQLAGLETGIPVSFGVLIDGGDPAARAGEAVRRGLEMADLFQQLRASAKAV